jgi:hypothetical protein
LPRLKSKGLNAVLHPGTIGQYVCQTRWVHQRRNAGAAGQGNNNSRNSKCQFQLLVLSSYDFAAAEEGVHLRAGNSNTFSENSIDVPGNSNHSPGIPNGFPWRNSAKGFFVFERYLHKCGFKTGREPKQSSPEKTQKRGGEKRPPPAPVVPKVRGAPLGIRHGTRNNRHWDLVAEIADERVELPVFKREHGTPNSKIKSEKIGTSSKLWI